MSTSRPPILVTSMSEHESSLTLTAMDSSHAFDTSTQRNSSMAGATGRIGVVLEDAVYWTGYREVNNVAAIVARGITAFLCVAQEVPMPSYVTSEDLDSGAVRFLKLNMMDDAGTLLQDHFACAFRFIDACRVANMPVVVYCRKGQSRSASIVAAYLMREYDIKFLDALQLLRQSRKADPNYAFCQQLTDFGEAPQRRLRAEDDMMPPPLALLRSAVSERIMYDASRTNGASARGGRALPSYFPQVISTEVSPRATRTSAEDLSVLRPFMSLEFQPLGTAAAGSDPLSAGDAPGGAAAAAVGHRFSMMDASLMTNPEMGIGAASHNGQSLLAQPLLDQDGSEDDDFDDMDDVAGSGRFDAKVLNHLSQSGVITNEGALTDDFITL